MILFDTKTDMESAWQKENPKLHQSFCPAKYVPHIYRGGWVIPGYGFSVERVGRYVAAGNAGNPMEVR